jgi:hypothetical protein
MLDILDKMDKVVRVMAIIACVSSLILTILSFIDLGPLVKLFGHKVEYEEGTYTIDGYASSLLGYKFTTPEDCMLDGESDRIDLSKGYYPATVKEKIENGTYVVDLSASYASSSTALVLVAFDESFSKKKEDKIMDFNDEKLKEYGVIDYGDSERTTLLGKNCYKFTAKVEGYISNAIADAYMFVEDGYMWIIEIVYIEGRESEAEELLNAFSVYE